MELNLSGKTALVTGASGGLGFAAALSLAAEGVRLAINSRSKENLTRAAQKINEKTGSAPLIVIGDLSETGAPERIATEARASLGAVDIFVSNAGGPPAGFFADLDQDAWRRSADLTLHSAIDLTRVVLPKMITRKWGRIIYITSVAVKQPIDNLIISNVLRAGLTGFAKSLSNQVARSGVTVNTVMPGYTRTERLSYLAEKEAATAGKEPDDIFAAWAEKVPAGRLGDPSELAALITFLASERAAYITGTAIPVDGGYIKSLL